MNFHLDDLSQFIEKNINPLLEAHSIITFAGPLGAGKSTLIREILRQKGVLEQITSPTFGYVKDYQLSSGTIIHHFDLYRINDLEAFIAAGFDEYLQQPNALCFIEWPEILTTLLEKSNFKNHCVHIRIDIDTQNSNTRSIEITLS